MIRLIAIDIDGTLLNSHGQVPDSHLQAIVGAAQRGIEIALVTGRSFHFARPVARLLPVSLTLVVSNGALVKDTEGVTLLQQLLPRDVARRVLADTRAYEESVALMFDRAPGHDERQVIFERMDWTHPNRRGYYEVNRAFIAEATAPLAEMLTEDPVQVMFNGSVAPMRSLAVALRSLSFADQFSISVTEYEHRDFALVDVNAAGCSKGSTLARWAASRGVTRDEVMAVGDNLNDLEMLEFAGTPVVMGNASAALRERGYYLTGTNDEGGLATAIQRFALQS